MTAVAVCGEGETDGPLGFSDLSETDEARAEDPFERRGESVALVEREPSESRGGGIVERTARREEVGFAGPEGGDSGMRIPAPEESKTVLASLFASFSLAKVGKGVWDREKEGVEDEEEEEDNELEEEDAPEDEERKVDESEGEEGEEGETEDEE